VCACLGEPDVQGDLLLGVFQHLLDSGDGLETALRRLRQHLAVDGACRAQVVRILGDERLERLPVIKAANVSVVRLGGRSEI